MASHRILAQTAALAVAIFLLLHLPHLGEPPNGFHMRREADTATVAERFWQGGLDLMTPHIYLLGADGTTAVGTELPVYTAATALAYATFGFSHYWPRLLSMLGALLLASATAGLARQLDPRRPMLAVAAGWLTLFSPLVFFYGVRIQPDLLGMGLATAGTVIILGGQTWLRLLLAAFCLGLAGGIKPTFWFVGLPILLALLRQFGALGSLRRPSLWCFAAAILLPVGLWFRHARALTADYGVAYFYLGDGWSDSLVFLADPQFYQNVFLRWPFELVVGLPLLPLFLVGLWRLPRLPNRWLIGSWLGGALVVMVMAAGHCASPHDYYYLPMVPGIVLVMAHGLVSLRDSTQHRTWAGLATGLAILAPVFSCLRVQHRFGEDAEFSALRAAVADLTPDAPILTIDRHPGNQLYRVGRTGWQAAPDAALQVVADAYRRGARFLAHTGDSMPLSAAALAVLHPVPRIRVGTTAIFEIRPEVTEASAGAPLLAR